MAGVLLEARPYRPFKSSEEYLYAMKEDLAEWLNMLYSELELNVDNFMDKLETGVVLCKHANSIKKSAEEYVARKHLRKMTSSQHMTTSLITKTALPITKMGEIIYRESAKPGTFFARDNVSNFIDFCRHGLEIIECLLFETDDLIMRKNEKNVILCLLEVARRGAKFGMLAPILIQMEREIDREIAAEQRLSRGDEEESSDEEELVPYGPVPQIVTNDLKSLDEMVRDLVEKCTCPTQFPMIRVSEGKYRIGDTKILIFVRILRSHVMVRVGGGWDTLSHYLDKHDPCRCRTGHKAAISSKLILKNTGAIELNHAQVHYERSPPRTRRSSASSSSSGHGGRDSRDLLSTYYNSTNRSRSPTPKRDNAKNSLQSSKYISTYFFDKASSPKRDRSFSPNGTNRPSYDAPTLASRNRSRSPSVRSPEPQRKNAEIHANIKQSDVKYLTASNLNGLDVEQARRAKVSTEANETSNNDDCKQTDSGSEVSDEGYRSLGLVVTTPVIGEGKIIVNGGKTQKSGHLAHLTSEGSEVTESPNSVCSYEDENQFLSLDEMKKKHARKSVSRERSVELSKNTLKTSSPSKNSSRVNSRSSSPARQTPTPTRRHSHVNETGTCRRKSNKENESHTGPRSRSATSRRTNLENVQSSKPMTNGVEFDKYGTWSGKSKKKSELHSDGSTHSSFVRNGVGRSSLGANMTSYDPSTGRRVQKQKEQKNVSPLITDLLKTKNLDDDKTVLLKMKEIIDQYSGIFEDPEKKFEDSGLEELDFTSEWVRNNGNIKQLEASDAEERNSPSKRKDSKYEGPNSKIPAPVFFKQNISEKEH